MLKPGVLNILLKNVLQDLWNFSLVLMFEAWNQLNILKRILQRQRL